MSAAAVSPAKAAVVGWAAGLLVGLYLAHRASARQVDELLARNAAQEQLLRRYDEVLDQIEPPLRALTTASAAARSFIESSLAGATCDVPSSGGRR